MDENEVMNLMKLSAAQVLELAKLARQQGQPLDLRGRNLSRIGLFEADHFGRRNIMGIAAAVEASACLRPS